MADDPLQLSFDPATIEHLGSNMYSRLPNAVAELVANSYDADATLIDVVVRGSGADQNIAVRDNGHGMSRDDVQTKYLRIGRNRRAALDSDVSESGRRKVSGKKGLGKLALFGIGGVVEVRTGRAGQPYGTKIVLDWDELRSGGSVYTPQEEQFPKELPVHGTTVAIRRLERKTDINPAELAASLSQLFNYADSTLKVRVLGRDQTDYPVDGTVRLEGIDAEFEWTLPESTALPTELRAILEGHKITGRVVAARKPLRTRLRGITVYANGRMVNEPEFFAASDSSYAYAYLTGYVQVDRLDEIKPDVIATDRRAVNWELPESRDIAEALRQAVTAIAQDRRRQRDVARARVTKERTGIDPGAWQASIKDQGKARNVGRLLGILTSEESDLSDAAMSTAVSELQELAPLYADLFWRTLHPVVQQAAEDPYKREHYLVAVVEGFKAFIELLREVTGNYDLEESSLIGTFLGSKNDQALLLLAGIDVAQIAGPSRKSFEEGHRELARGVQSAFRNPVSHQSLVHLEKAGIYTWQDCLDALSIVSYLCRRVSGVAATRDRTRGQGG